MASASDATQELIDQRLDTIDRALMGLMPRGERLKFMAEVETMVREGGNLNSVLAEEVVEVQTSPRRTEADSPRGRRGRSRLALTSGVMGITALVLLFMVPLTYIVACMTGEEVVVYASLGLNALAVALGGAAAVALGIAALVRLNRRHCRQVGHGWAITGLCTGPLPMLIGGLAMLAVVIPNAGLVVSEYGDAPVAGYMPSTNDPPGDMAVPVSHEGTVAAAEWDPKENEPLAPSRPGTNLDQGFEEPRQLEPRNSPANPPPYGAYPTPPSATVLPPSEGTDPPISAAGDEAVLPRSSTEGAEHPVAVRYSLRNAAVKDVADQIAASLESTSDKIAIDPDTNALTVRALPIEQERISRLLAKLDATPIAVEIKCLLTRIGPDGKRSVLSKPQVRTLDGIEAMISVGSTDGESYEVTLVPKVILPEQVMDGVRQASSDMPPGR
jgi:hypothetical protein